MPAIDLEDLPDPRRRPALPIVEAGGWVGLGRTASYEAAKRGELPTLRFGRRLMVPTAKLLALLGLDSDQRPPAA